jgi:enamine deaminase RidA (YjgF/YER057c/UK114 family)
MMGRRQGPGPRHRAALPERARFNTSTEGATDMTRPEPVFPPGRHALYETHRYSAAIRSGDLLFVSGQVGSRDDGSPEPDFERQVQRAFENLRATLEAAGCGFDDVLDVTTFHTDPQAQFETWLKIKNQHFPTPPYPAWTAVGVTWLAGFDFEIKVVARIPGSP